mmetsp:Transcript_11093/g.18766  ORF Transcript_11093/g.18766 Transcript_11093/m.18766 type:complete len:100 (+) Transcript_11093:287-586(+)
MVELHGCTGKYALQMQYALVPTPEEKAIKMVNSNEKKERWQQSWSVSCGVCGAPPILKKRCTQRGLSAASMLFQSHRLPKSMKLRGGLCACGVHAVNSQ